jgi:hypothetical protein
MNISCFGLMAGLLRIAWAHSGLFEIVASFGSLAGSTVTNIGRSVVDGSLGV